MPSYVLLEMNRFFTFGTKLGKLLNFKVNALVLCFADVYYEFYKFNALTLLD